MTEVVPSFTEAQMEELVKTPFPLNDIWKLTIKAIDLNDQRGKQQVETDWLSSFKDIFTFNTIQDFWSLVNNINNLVRVPVGTTYAFFKKDTDGSFTKPSWEDPNNISGFTYNIYISTRDRGNGVLPEGEIAKLFIEILMLLVGNTLHDSSQINGCTFDRKFVSYKLTIWIKSRLAISRRLVDDLDEYLDIDTLTSRKLVSKTVDENIKDP